MPLPILSKESLSSSEQKKKDEEKTFSVTILVNENEKNKIVDLLHKAKSIISKKVEKVMGKKPKTGISNVDALQTVLENWLDKTESEEREEDLLVEQLIHEQESQVETMLMDGRYAPVTYPTVPTVSVCNPEELYADREELGEDMEVARLTSPVLLQPPPPRRARVSPSETPLSPTRSLSPCDTVPRPFGYRPDSELYPPRLRRPSSLYGAGAAAASSRPPSRQVSVSPSVVATQDREEQLLSMPKLNINPEEQDGEEEDEWEYEEETTIPEEEEGKGVYTEKRPYKYTRPDSFIVPIGGVWNPRDDPMEAEVKWSTVEVLEETEPAEEKKLPADTGDETYGGGEGEAACQRVSRRLPVQPQETNTHPSL